MNKVDLNGSVVKADIVNQVYEKVGFTRQEAVQAVETLFEEIKSGWGRLDVMCANAGIKGPTASVENISLKEWKECLGLNYRLNQSLHMLQVTIMMRLLM